MKAAEIWSVICSLDMSTGMYGSLKSSILESGRKEEILSYLEEQNFGSQLDLILFFEQ